MGNITQERGILNLIYSVKIVGKSFKNLKLVIAGKWVKQDYFKDEVEETIKKYKLENFIEFAGFLGEEEKMKFFLNTDIFVYPSLNEGQPLVILEAMAAGCPVIANKDVGAISETVINGKTGILVDKMKIEELSSAIFKINQKRILKIRNGR